MNRIIIGIDNGVSGAMVAVSAHHGLIVDKTVMPTAVHVYEFKKNKIKKKNGVKQTVRDLHRENEIDALLVVQWIRSVTDSNPCQIFIEECPEHAKQKSTMRSMAISYGILTGAIRAALPEYSLHVVRSGNPVDSWQRKMLGGIRRGDTKPVALAKAMQLWPDESWLATPRCKKPHDGMIDAALIAEYGRIKNL